MKDRAALVERLGRKIYILYSVTYGDEAWKVHEEWGIQLTVISDPRIPENVQYIAKPEMMQRIQ